MTSLNDKTTAEQQFKKNILQINNRIFINKFVTSIPD